MHLLFDYGGVLVRLDKTRCISRFAALGFDIQPYLGTFKQSGLFSDLESGRTDVPTFCETLRQLAGEQRDGGLETAAPTCETAAPTYAALTDEAIIAAWQSYLVEVPQARLDMLLKIRQHYPVSLLSNTNPVHWQMAEADYFRHGGHTVSDYFDRVFLSYEIGCEKPAPEIFEAVVRGLNCPAEDILFFDDSATNCEAARRCGLQARVAPADGSWMEFFDADGRLRS